MFLHIGDNKTVPMRDILVILPLPTKDSLILLADGGEIRSPIAAATLRKRLDAATMPWLQGQRLSDDR